MPKDRAIDRFVEWLFERIEHIERLSHGSIYRYQVHANHGPDMTLVDGTVVHHGDPILELHMDNDRTRELMGETGGGRRFALAFLHAGEAGLAEVARLSDAGTLPEFKAVFANTPARFVPIAEKLGYETRELPRTLRNRVIASIQRGVLKRYDIEGWRRIDKDSPLLFPVEVWMSHQKLLSWYLGWRMPGS